jgi:ribosomal protein L28
LAVAVFAASHVLATSQAIGFPPLFLSKKKKETAKGSSNTVVPVGIDEAAEVAMDRECSPLAATTRSGTGRSHSEAERKRRQRINAHLATLRTLLPAASRVRKTDVTSLLFRS